MTKLAILGDCHHGMRNDSPIFHDLYERFYQEIFFPTLKARGINIIIQTGDLFDRRKFINFNSLNRARKYFFDNLVEYNIEMITYIGNHDCFYRNTLELNSPELLLFEYIDSKNVTVIKEPTTLKFYDIAPGGNTQFIKEQLGSIEVSAPVLVTSNIAIDIIPWICQDNEQKIKAFIANTRSQICFGHFELVGFEMENGIACHEGMSRDELKGYDMVVSGHFHHKSTDGHIWYVGSPGEQTWADFDDPRGFHIFDTDTRSLEFIENPHKMFYKIEYDDTKETLESIDNKDYSEYSNKFVKVVVKNKNSHMLFDRFINNFYQATPADLGIVEDFIDYTAVGNLMEEGVDQAEHTHILLDKYVDAIEMPLDKNKMKAVMRKIYHEAHTKDSA